MFLQREKQGTERYHINCWVLPSHTYSSHTVASSLYSSFSVVNMFSPWEAWIWQSSSFPGSLCISHAELSSETNSWACVHVCQMGSYLVFQSQLASAPPGVFSAWEHKGSPGARPYTLCTVYICVCHCVSQLGTSVRTAAPYSGIAPISFLVSCILVFIPFPPRDPNSQFLPPDTGSWSEKKQG